jgi:hypothetical protein
MRLHCRISSRLRAILPAFFIIAASFSAPAFGQSATELPSAWTNAVRGLADKIGAAVGTTQGISLDVKNMSSLSPSDVSVARQALENELTQRHFRIVSAPSAASAVPSDASAQVRVTFSEGIEGLVWVAEIRTSNAPDDAQDDALQVAIVTVAKSAAGGVHAPKESLTLNKKLVWEQPGKFLDFASFQPTEADSASLLILEPARLALYRSSSSQWQLSQSAVIARSNALPRDVTGRIDIAAQKVSLSGLECAGDLQQPQSVKCIAASGQSGDPALKIPGHEESESAQLGAKCGDANIELVTGNGDWTQPDTIQGIELANPQATPVVASDPMGMDGPVISLWAPPNENDARAIVYNLKTNHYEGYLVTATCTH